MICRTANPTLLQLFRGAPWSRRESRHWTVLCHHLVVRPRLTRGITLVSCHIWWTSHWEKMYVETKRATARQNQQNDLCAQQIFRSAWASSQSEDSDQTGQMPRLIWGFAGCTAILLVLLCISSYEPCQEKTCLCHMRTTKAQINLTVWSVPLLFTA